MGTAWRSVCVLLAAVALGAPHPPEPRAQVQQNQAAADLNASAARIVDAINNVAVEKDFGCEDRTDKRGSDLCAQWKAADAARDAADYTFLAVLLSFIGTTLVAATFWEQRKVSRSQLRAYLTIQLTDLVTIEDKGPLVTKLVIGNSGQTPATKVATSWRVFASAPPYAPEFETLEPAKSSGLLGPGDTGNMYPRLDDIPTGMIERIRSGTCHVIMHGSITYQDAFRRSRRTSFRYQLAFEAGQALWKVCDSGNDAT